MRVVSCARVGQAGDDDAPRARAPRYHPACRAFAWPLDYGCDGPTRSVLLSQAGCSSEGSPVIAGSMPLSRFYGTPQIKYCTPRGYLASGKTCGRVAPRSHEHGWSLSIGLGLNFE